MSKIKHPALKTMVGVPHDTPIGIVIPVYNYVNNTNLAQAMYTVEQCSDLPYQLSLGIGPQCVAANRIKGEQRLDPAIRYVIQMDDDVLVPPGFMSKFLSVIQQGTSHGDALGEATIGAVSAVMYGPRGEAQNDLHPDVVPVGTQKKCLPPGTCFMYDRKATPVMWDMKYQGSQWEDTDAMMQIRKAGLDTVATGNVQILHKNSWSENKWWNENKAHFESKWPGALS
jgi:hypothetical protein